MRHSRYGRHLEESPKASTVTIVVKNWRKFQHYKKRNPPWIRLYKSLLDDQDFANLSDFAVRLLFMVWLLGSEGENHGRIPMDSRALAWRLRVASTTQIDDALAELTPSFIEVYPDDASTPLATCKQDATPETETEAEVTETETYTETDSSEAETEADNSHGVLNKKGNPRGGDPQLIGQIMDKWNQKRA